MSNSEEKKNKNKVVTFLKGLFDKLDKKMEEKSKGGTCCAKGGKKSCCS